MDLSNIQKLGTIMGIWAHPDDETFSMAGIMATAVTNGQKVICVTATRGEAGVQDESRWPAHSLADTRTQELHDALDILGVTDHIFLDYPDGGCNAVDQQQAIQHITTLIEVHQPDTILTFGPDGLTGHNDHSTVSAWAVAAAAKTTKTPTVYFVIQTTEQYEAMIEADRALNVFFNIDKPPIKDACDCDLCYVLDDEVLEKKLRALQAMPSQTEKMFTMFKDHMPAFIGTEAFTRYTNT